MLALRSGENIMLVRQEVELYEIFQLYRYLQVEVSKTKYIWR